MDKPTSAGLSLRLVMVRPPFYVSEIVLCLLALFPFGPSLANSMATQGPSDGRAYSGSASDDSSRVKVNALLRKNGSLAQPSSGDQIRKALPQFNPFHYVDVARVPRRLNMLRELRTLVSSTPDVVR